MSKRENSSRPFHLSLVREKNTWAGIDGAASSGVNSPSCSGAEERKMRAENRRQINILIKGLDFSLAAFHAEQGEMRPHFPPIEFPSGEHKNMVRSGERESARRMGLGERKGGC
jgi:hypothetical protein